jgi:MFS family permease
MSAQRSTVQQPDQDLEDAPSSSRVADAVLGIVLLSLLLIPIRIIRYGFRPMVDDTPADAAKAVSGRPWTDVLVLKDTFQLDPHVGWHALLRAIFLTTGLGTKGLVVLAVVALFVLFAWSLVAWLDRPEAWLATLLLVVGVGTGLMERYTLGRPFLISATVLVTILALWYRRGEYPPSRRTMVIMAALIAIAVLLHGSWYLWLLPIAAFCLAGQWPWARALAASWVVGTLVGALLTGSPAGYLAESVRMGFEAFGRHSYQSTLVHEFQPMPENLAGLLLLGGLVAFRELGGFVSRPLRANPAFWLACLGLALGFKAMRFWGDWGIVALMVLITFDVQAFLVTRLAATSAKRVALAAGLGATLWMATTSDADSRWTASASTRYLVQDDPQAAGWLPDAGGVLYSSEMALFYQTFFRNPHAPWRYITGFEPAMMPDDDFQTYQIIGLNHGNPLAYMPWVKKLRAQDRVAMHWPEQPRIPELEWKSVSGVWLGRLPRGAGVAGAP